jgi:cytochrome P450
VSNLISPEMQANPYPMYALMRQASPVYFNEESGTWSVFGYDDVKHVLTENDLFASSPHRMAQPQAGNRFSGSMINTDPPEHTRLRALVSRVFTPRAVASLEGRITELTTSLIDAVIASGQLDLVHDLSAPLPVMVISEMLGIPPADRKQFKQWSDVIVASSNNIIGDDLALAEASGRAMHAMYEYFAPIMQQRRAEPREDLISRLAGVEVDGERLSDSDIFSFCWLLLVAGNETTTNLIGSAILTLLEEPAALARLRAEPELLPNAIEEVLRYRSPVQAMFRFAARAVELHGQTIEQGRVVLAWIGSANRDERRFPEPDRFDIERTPNPHIAFGNGIHFCLGAPLARLEARVALAAILERLPDLARVDDAPLAPVEGMIVHGVKSLPLRFKAG